MSDIITLIYTHKHSAPSPGSPCYSERHAPFSAAVSLAKISHAYPLLFTWATNFVADHACREIYGLTGKNDHVHIRASTNGQLERLDCVNLVTWGALGKSRLSSMASLREIQILCTCGLASCWIYGCIAQERLHCGIKEVTTTCNCKCLSLIYHRQR